MVNFLKNVYYLIRMYFYSNTTRGIAWVPFLLTIMFPFIIIGLSYFCYMNINFNAIWLSFLDAYDSTSGKMPRSLVAAQAELEASRPVKQVHTKFSFIDQCKNLGENIGNVGYHILTDKKWVIGLTVLSWSVYIGCAYMGYIPNIVNFLPSFLDVKVAAPAIAGAATTITSVMIDPNTNFDSIMDQYQHLRLLSIYYELEDGGKLLFDCKTVGQVLDNNLIEKLIKDNKILTSSNMIDNTKMLPVSIETVNMLKLSQIEDVEDDVDSFDGFDTYVSDETYNMHLSTVPIEMLMNFEKSNLFFFTMMDPVSMLTKMRDLLESDNIDTVEVFNKINEIKDLNEQELFEALKADQTSLLTKVRDLKEFNELELVDILKLNKVDALKAIQELKALNEDELLKILHLGKERFMKGYAYGIFELPQSKTFFKTKSIFTDSIFMDNAREKVNINFNFDELSSLRVIINGKNLFRICFDLNMSRPVPFSNEAWSEKLLEKIVLSESNTKLVNKIRNSWGLLKVQPMVSISETILSSPSLKTSALNLANSMDVSWGSSKIEPEEIKIEPEEIKIEPEEIKVKPEIKNEPEEIKVKPEIKNESMQKSFDGPTYFNRVTDHSAIRQPGGIFGMQMKALNEMFALDREHQIIRISDLKKANAEAIIHESQQSVKVEEKPNIVAQQSVKVEEKPNIVAQQSVKVEEKPNIAPSVAVATAQYQPADDPEFVQFVESVKSGDFYKTNRPSRNPQAAREAREALMQLFKELNIDIQQLQQSENKPKTENRNSR